MARPKRYLYVVAPEAALSRDMYLYSKWSKDSDSPCLQENTLKRTDKENGLFALYQKGNNLHLLLRRIFELFPVWAISNKAAVNIHLRNICFHFTGVKTYQWKGGAGL